MSKSMIWKSVAFWVVVLAVLAVATAMIPGGDSIPQPVMIAVILAIAIPYMWYLKRMQQRS